MDLAPPPIALVSQLPILEPVHRGSHLKQGSELNRVKHLKHDNTEQYAISPYQALPITGPVHPTPDRESKSTTLPIKEPDMNLTTQV